MYKDHMYTSEKYIDRFQVYIVIVSRHTQIHTPAVSDTSYLSVSHVPSTVVMCHSHVYFLYNFIVFDNLIISL